MPRAKSVPSSEGRREFERLWAEQSGSPLDFMLSEWDGDAQVFYDAVLALSSTGAAVFIRAGAGKRSLGVAIWEGDDRYPATWCNEADELTAWCKGVLGRFKKIQEANTKA